MKRIAVLALAVASLLAVAPAAEAKPQPAPVVLTAQQLTDLGFTTAVNTVAWGQPVTLSAQTASVWQDVVAKGRAPETVPVGQVLTMWRYQATNTKGDGAFKQLNIATTVGPDRNFSLHFQLGYPGVWGYRVGYSTSGDSPEFVGFQFQFTTTGSAKPLPKANDAAVILTSKQLANAGFTKQANLVGWGGTGTLSAHKVKAGQPVTISGKAPTALTPGTILTLKRFVATDTLGSGTFEPISNAITAVQADQSYSLTFEPAQRGVVGYTLGAVSGDQWLGIEFQVKAT